MMRSLMKRFLLLFCLPLAFILSGCDALPGSASSNEQIAELTAENQELQASYDQLREQVEELDEAVKTTGFLEPQVIVEPATFAGGSETLEKVISRGELHCGININAPGLGYLDTETNRVTGFDIDLCRAIAAAVFGPSGAEQIESTAVTNRSRFPMLQAGDIDVLIRNTTWTLTRDGEYRLDFAGPTLYDGAGMIVRNEDGHKNLRTLAGGKICVLTGGTTESAVTSYYDSLDETVELISFVDEDSARSAYERGQCDGLANDKTRLVGQRLLLEDPDAHTILRDEMSREPLGPVIRQNDSNWLDVVNWVFQCTLNAEYMGVSKRNVRFLRDNSDDIAVQRLLGTAGELGQGLGLENDFCYQVVSQVGNYGEIYASHFGPSTPYSLPRGNNALYIDGGLHYPLPFQ